MEAREIPLLGVLLTEYKGVEIPQRAERLNRSKMHNFNSR